jgi:ketosteroid isomerase-like protein
MDNNTKTDQLPTTVRAFTEAHAARDADAALALLTPGAVISDVGESFSGEDSLRSFVSKAGAEFTYTDQITTVARDGDVWVVGHHLEGDFPGGTADLDYRFSLDGERIARIDIVLG